MIKRRAHAQTIDLDGKSKGWTGNIDSKNSHQLTEVPGYETEDNRIFGSHDGGLWMFFKFI